MARSRTDKAANPDAASAPSNVVAPGPDGGDGPTIDAVLGGLEKVVEQLEGGDLPLEEALARFEQGVALARRGSAMLDQVEERVQVLLAGDEGGTVPFVADDDREG